MRYSLEGSRSPASAGRARCAASLPAVTIAAFAMLCAWSLAAARVAPDAPEEGASSVSEDVRFSHEEGAPAFAATWVRPAGDGPFPAVLLLSPAGDHPRDEIRSGSRHNADLARRLAESGIASLRVDSRGVGDSKCDAWPEWDWSRTSDDLATDVAGHLRYLASLDAVDRDRVGVVAHGDACVPAMLHEARVGGLAFTVLLSPPGISGRDNLVQGQLARLPAERREELGALMRAGIDKIIEAADRDEAIATLAKAFAAMGVPQEQATAGASGFHDQLANAWTRHFLGYDPADAFSEIESPLLALFTDTDERYPSGPNAERIRSTLREARAVHSEVRTLRGLDHFLSAQPPEGSDERPIVYADPVVEAVIGFIESAMDRSDERHLRPGR